MTKTGPQRPAGADLSHEQGAQVSQGGQGAERPVDAQTRERVARDRRELWHLESFLAVNGTNPGHHARRLRLYRYLCETCEHEWSDVSGWGGCPGGTHQCSWCNKVLEPDEWRALLGDVDTQPEPGDEGRDQGSAYWSDPQLTKPTPEQLARIKASRDAQHEGGERS